MIESLIRLSKMYIVLPISCSLCLLLCGSPTNAAIIKYISQGSSDRLIIFIHGIYGDPDATFRNSSATKSWPELMSEDNRKMRVGAGPPLSDYTVASVTIESSRDSTLSIEELSTRLATDLIDAGVFDEYQHVFFIAHSMGGILLKRMLIASAFDPRFAVILDRTQAAILISVPSKGSEAANFLSRLPSFFTGKPIIDLQTIDQNSFLRIVDGLWWSFLKRTHRPAVFCAYETQAVAGITVVPEIYTESQCDNIPRGEPRDHISIVKPIDQNDSVYEWARGRIAEASSGIKDSPTGDSREKTGLLIKRIIGEPTRPVSVTTVWLGATGSDSITIDAIRVVHNESNLVSGITGAQQPDATYNFVYEPGSDTTFPLQPALVLSPDDRRDVSFVLTLKPRETVSGNSSVTVELLYRTSGGESGALSLEEPEDGLYTLARMLHHNVILKDLDRPFSVPQVLTPEGYQTLQSPTDGDPFRWDNPSIRSLQWSHKGGDFAQTFPGAKRIADVLVSENLADQVRELVRSDPNEFSLTLCAVLGSVCREELYVSLTRNLRSPATLRRSWEDQYRLNNFLSAVALSHYVAPSSDLEMLLDTSKDKLMNLSDEGMEDLFVALGDAPTPTWIDTLLAYAPAFPEVMEVFLAKRGALPRNRYKEIINAAWTIMSEENVARDNLVPIIDIVFQLDWPNIDAIKRLDAMLSRRVETKSAVSEYKTQQFIDLNRRLGIQIVADQSGLPIIISDLGFRPVWPSMLHVSQISGEPVEMETTWATLDYRHGGSEHSLKDLVSRTPERDRIMRAIVANGQEAILQSMASDLRYGSYYLVELLGESKSIDSTRILLHSLCKDPLKAEPALRALAHLHVNFPSADLNNGYHDCAKREFDYVTSYQIAVASAVQAFNGWDGLISEIIQSVPSNFYKDNFYEILYLSRDKITPRIVDQLAKQIGMCNVGQKRGSSCLDKSEEGYGSLLYRWLQSKQNNASR
ncbi:MAG: hypothetical protein WAS21_05735 [Geminicoccaceae bacterium]